MKENGIVKNETKTFVKTNKSLFERLAQGDKRARDELILSNTKLVNHVYNKNFRKVYYAEYEDMYQAGILGLIKAVDTYNPSKPFPPYAYVCIRNEMLMLMRYASKHKDEVSLDAPMCSEQEDTFCETLDVEKYKPDEIINPEAILIDKEQHNIRLVSLKKILNDKINPFYSQILTQRYFSSNEVVSQKAVAENLNVTQSCVSRAEYKAINMCKKLVREDVELRDVID